MTRQLCDYAVSEDKSKGRKFPEKAHPYRTDFERDRDRIIHSEAFRRLEGKTQVFTPGINDNYRNRLTHSIEVAQIGRTIARALGLNEDLTEAICLAHDLGHPPFGHTGEKILDEITTDIGGFEHNSQSLRIVDLLEHPYPGFAGLNLMYETRLGLAKHKTTYDKIQQSFFDEKNCSLEGQVADIADRIAYNCHDLEDGLRAGLIDIEKLKNIQLFRQAQDSIQAFEIKDPAVLRTRTAKAIIDILVSDCVSAGKTILKNSRIKSVDDVYAISDNLIVLSAQSEENLKELENFLLSDFYSQQTLTLPTDQIRQQLEKLFDSLCRNSGQLPAYYQHLIEKQGLKRTVCDYIAGMTDRFWQRMINRI